MCKCWLAAPGLTTCTEARNRVVADWTHHMSVEDFAILEGGKGGLLLSPTTTTAPLLSGRMLAFANS